MGCFGTNLVMLNQSQIMSRIPRPALLAKELRATFCTSLPRVTVAVMASDTGHGVTICTSLSHVHPTGTVAVMASGTGTWGDVLYITVPCPPNRYSCCDGLRNGDMGRGSVRHYSCFEVYIDRFVKLNMTCMNYSLLKNSNFTFIPRQQ
ncbi:hypothetical protein AVEN_144395-1 [Araneus ventricosus]|uniref:Uncharacterized protein n=1 Tax=Araneus ventricosus TaxID=182803 RepID=A0A4Y2T9R4_ARAVE|nr:hypothetical protein AVEN_144395-1 [Araneus ventricosus]